MKVIVLSLVLLATTWLPATEAWLKASVGIDLGRRSKTAKECPFTCVRNCPDSSCYVICANECSLREAAANDKHIQSFPHDFKAYDKNGDGFISLGEMEKALKADKESSLAALTLADDNGDKKLSVKEFDAAPYHKPGPGDKPKAERYFEESDMEEDYEE